MSTRAALRYAKAVFNLAKINEQDETVYKDMQLLSDTIAESKDLKLLLESPIIKAADKVKTVEAVFAGKLNNYSLGLVKLLANNKRLNLLKSVAGDYQVIYQHSKSVDTATVITAVPINAALEAKVIAKVKEITGNETTLVNEVKPEIIGGFILRVGDKQYDASIAKSFTALERKFDDSHYEAKI